MGIGNARLVRTRHAFKGVDMRQFGAVGYRAAQSAASVSAFLERMYWSIGETLPHAQEPQRFAF